MELAGRTQTMRGLTVYTFIVYIDCVPLKKKKVHFFCVTSNVMLVQLCLTGQTVGWQQKSTVCSQLMFWKGLLSKNVYKSTGCTTLLYVICFRDDAKKRLQCTGKVFIYG